MIKLNLGKTEGPFRILCIGAHGDDIEIGCGGSILRLIDELPNAEVDWIVFSAGAERATEAQKSADKFLRNADRRNIVIKNFRDSFFPYIGGEIKDYFRSLQQSCEPDLIFTHCSSDLHQDHRLLSELTWNTFRDHLILEYEIPKWDGDLGRPNFFININAETVDKKIAIITDTFQSQKKRDWFSKDTFTSLMRLRGMESRSASNYAEAYFCRKMII